MTRIDLQDVLQQTACSRYGDLVTRRTGEVVRGGIEALLPDDDDTAIIDFGTVRLMDISCADEIVGKLLLAHGRARRFLLVGVHAAHEDALLPVLERHGLAVVAEDRTGRLKVLGHLPEPALRAFGLLADLETAEAAEVAARLALEPAEALQALELLRRHRVVQEQGGQYRAVRCA